MSARARASPPVWPAATGWDCRRIVTLRWKRSAPLASVSDCAACAIFRIYHQLGGRTDGLPLWHLGSWFITSSVAEFTSELPEALGASLRHEKCTLHSRRPRRSRDGGWRSLISGSRNRSSEHRRRQRSPALCLVHCLQPAKPCRDPLAMLRRGYLGRVIGRQRTGINYSPTELTYSYRIHLLVNRRVPAISWPKDGCSVNRAPFVDRCRAVSGAVSADDPEMPSAPRQGVDLSAARRRVHNPGLAAVQTAVHFSAVSRARHPFRLTLVKG